MQKITPFLWFDRQAEAAVKFYTSVFKGSKILSVARYGKATEGVTGLRAGTVMTVCFRMLGQEFVALNGGPVFKFNEAISFVVNCATQKEIDYYWAKLSAGGEKGQCGWLKDRYGVSWQIVPAQIEKLISAKDPERVNRVMAAVLTMTKLDLKKLQRAAAGK